MATHALRDRDQLLLLLFARLPGTRSTARQQFWQVAWAVLNAGENGLTPVPSRLIPPWPLGSGKPVTPWLRMHSEKARNDPRCDEAFGSWPDDPQPAIARTQTPAVTAASRRRRQIGSVNDIAVEGDQPGSSARSITTT